MAFEEIKKVVFPSFESVEVGYTMEGYYRGEEPNKFGRTNSIIDGSENVFKFSTPAFLGYKVKDGLIKVGDYIQLTYTGKDKKPTKKGVSPANTFKLLIDKSRSESVSSPVTPVTPAVTATVNTEKEFNIDDFEGV